MGNPATIAEKYSRYPDIHQAIALGYGTMATIRRRIASGELPRVKIIRDGRRKNIFDPVDLDRVLGARPEPVGPAAEVTALDAAVDDVVARAPRLSSAQLARLGSILDGGAR
ncbi:hypothetical protein ICL81_08030 [Leucobacter sp. cx-328]|uniref:hypothetical protein n=1 Tax=unclassified Leucobacter TaxID=2621730 RepID=UPI00165E1AE3|nr:MULTISPECIES: hypothetical protein [unclassified Leucobacter]MBC9944456.1 hypothetical protein [Leucobacter sp. cx-328]